MPKLEADYKARLVKQARAKGAYARRFEDRFAVGLLDIIIIPPCGLTYFIEGKLIARTFGPTKRQFIEGERILATKSLAKPLLIGWDDLGVMYIAPKWLPVVSKHDCWSSPRDRGNYYETLMEFINHG